MGALGSSTQNQARNFDPSLTSLGSVCSLLVDGCNSQKLSTGLKQIQSLLGFSSFFPIYVSHPRILLSLSLVRARIYFRNRENKKGKAEKTRQDKPNREEVYLLSHPGANWPSHVSPPQQCIQPRTDSIRYSVDKLFSKVLIFFLCVPRLSTVCCCKIVSLK